MSRSSLVAVFNRFPKELFRVNNGPAVKLRAWRPNRYVYDVVPENGFVKPKALDPSTYLGQRAHHARKWHSTLTGSLAFHDLAPNGASLRPNSPYQQSLVSWRFHGDDVIVYAIPEGIPLSFIVCSMPRC
jgi:hypothetical protein